MLENYNNESLFVYNELIENDNNKGFAKKLLNIANIFYYKNDSNKFSAKRTPILFTFWNQNKTGEEANKAELSDNEWLDKANKDEADKDDTEDLSEDEIKISN
ncbi:3425_t:CDS:2, partial [Racocetra persica]